MRLIKDYINIIIVALIVIVLLRLIELIYIVYNFGFSYSILNFEFVGLLLDIIIIGFFLYIWYFLYRIIFKITPKVANIVFLAGVIIFDVLHLIVLKYFLYQLRPLDIFLYSHSLRESLFSLNTSNTDFSDMIFISIFISAVVIISFQYIKGRTISDWESKVVKNVLLITIVLFPVFEVFDIFSYNNFTINKSYYFYKRSIGYVLGKQKSKFIEFDKKILSTYQKTNNSFDYLSPEYPYLHKFENKDVIGKYFNIGSKKPNLVFLIVEGMSDEFIHRYKGVKFMPFVDSLSKTGLYWSNFFTMGERSFAVVPSITGGLPYGERGFTLLDKLPYHFSLVNILKTNEYYSIYFDSQDAWFHDKDKYFKFDNIDRIFDKNDFSSQFKKIKVGKEKYFWGYTDKDLFNQALITIDTLPKEKRLEIYFTGTMHSPFAINDSEKYNKLFDKKIDVIKDERILKIFAIYKKQLLSLMYTNDAIEDFIRLYKQKEGYENTIFIITGDHPMTEIPPEDGVKKYHVPLIFYSPLLKERKLFEGISSHLDVYETLLSFLNVNYDIKIPDISTSLGHKLDTSSVFNDKRTYAFMNDNREIVDYYKNGKFLSNERYVFEVKQDFKVNEIKNREIKTNLENNLYVFNKTNTYVTTKNKLLPEKEYMDFFDYDKIYFYSDTSCVTFRDEYSYIIEDIPIRNTNMYIDISLEFIPKINDKTFVYCTLSNNAGKIKFKHSFNLSYRLQEHIKVSDLAPRDSILYLSVYLDNKTFKKIEYCNPMINAYSF